MKPQKPNDGEVSKHLVQRTSPKVPSCLAVFVCFFVSCFSRMKDDRKNIRNIAAFVGGHKLLLDPGLLDERVEDVEDRVDVPDVWVVLEPLDLLPRLGLELGAVLAEGLELVNELINNVPEPLVRELKLDGGVRVQNVVEQVTIVLKGGKTMVQGGLQLGVDVPEGKLIVEDQEHTVIVDQRRHQRGFGPRQVGKVTFAELVPRRIIASLDLGQILLNYTVLEKHHKVADRRIHSLIPAWLES